MTPERLSELQASIEAARRIAPRHLDKVLVDESCELTIAELDVLLAIAQRAAETCEWAKINLVHGTAFKTACGRRANHYDATLNGRPCWCGRTVAVRDGRT